MRIKFIIIKLLRHSGKFG